MTQVRPDFVDIPYGTSGAGCMGDPRIKEVVQLIWNKAGYGTSRQELRDDDVVEIYFWHSDYVDRLREIVTHDEMEVTPSPSSGNPSAQVVTFPLTAVPEIVAQLKRAS